MAALVILVLATAASAGGDRVARPFPAMVFMENNTCDGPRREGLNFTIKQEHDRQVWPTGARGDGVAGQP